jgi:hypothetical protein
MNGFSWGWLTSTLDEGFSPRNIALLLWAGLAVLTLSLLVLARTRWGQAQPLSKCVFLSLYAHFLLGGYAYTTQVILEPPPLPREPVIRLTHVAESVNANTADTTEAPTGRSDAGQTPSKPWEQSADAPPPPDLPSPDRQAAAAPAEPTRTSETDEPRMLDMAPTDAALAQDTNEQPAADVTRKIAAISAVAPPSEIEQPAPPPAPAEKPSSPEPELPGVGALARIETAPQEMTPVRRPEAPDLPQELFNPAGLQRLTDAVPTDMADAVRSEQDQLAAALNRDNDLTNHRLEESGSTPTLSRGADFQAALGSAVAALPIPRRLGDGAELPGLYRLRVGEGRALAARQLGATAETETAVEAALRWFSTHQEADGRWSAAAHGAGREDRVLGHDRGGAGGKGDTGVTALALLCFLGAGHTHLEGPYANQVQRGLEFLLRSQRTDGDLSSEAEFFARMYCHGMASLALSEAYALSGDARLQPFVERAVAFSLSCQHPVNGGWRYQKGDLGDMSQFGWQVMALKSAELAGLTIPQTTRDGMNRFLRGASSGVHGGLASYRGGERVSRTMTAEALACRYFLNGEPNADLRREAVSFLLEEPPQAGRPNFYYWYYGTLALFQTQDNHWTAWNAALQGQLLARQRRDGEHAGSWDPDCIWGGYGGRVYTTAMGCLCLEVYYRYLPITAGK